MSPLTPLAFSSRSRSLKSTEFRLWLKEEKRKVRISATTDVWSEGRKGDVELTLLLHLLSPFPRCCLLFAFQYIDQLSGEDSRHYFKKFVKKWNRGELDKSYYHSTSSTSRPASSVSSYQWKIKVDQSQIEHARKTVDAETNLDRSAAPSAPPPPPSRVFGGRVVGSAAPPPPSRVGGFSESDRVMDREERKERQRAERKAERKKSEKEEKEERSGGREGRIEKRKETNASNREMRNKSPGGLEVDEATLMGTGGANDSFAAR